MNETLYEFIQQATQLNLHREPGQQLAALIQSSFNLEGVALFDADLNKIYKTGTWFADMENAVRNIYFFESVADDPETGLVRRVLRIRNLPVGALLLRGEMCASSSSAVACVVAITFDRYHSHANVSRTESARRTEQMRTTVLDSLAHAYKTPLTAIRAASTGLNEMGNLTAAQAELVQLIGEQSELLSDLTTRLLKTARLEAHDLILRKETVAVGPLLEDVVASFRAEFANTPVTIAVPREDLSIQCDRDLLIAVLTQYLDNAGKYSRTGSPVTIEVAEHPEEMIFSVHSIGPGIKPADRERVFDRYYRGEGTAGRMSGTGIGLSVAKRAAQAHGGDVWLTSDRARGTTFFASLPVDSKEGPAS
jgi:two-component system, OmpR family, sensor histidine kinase KdpD